MAVVRFVPVANLVQFTGTNVNELPLDNYLNAYGPNSGHTSVVGGVLTITWPGIDGPVPAVINTGDWLDPNGAVLPGEAVSQGYVPLSQLGSLL